MSAVVARRSAPIQRTIPATQVEQLTDATQLPHFSGLQMLQVCASLCWPVIEVEDVINVDFDVRTFTHDYLYLVTCHDNGHDRPPTWFGARFFMRMLSGVMVRNETANGPEWVEAPPALLASFRFHGVVRGIWKKVRPL